MTPVVGLFLMLAAVVLTTAEEPSSKYVGERYVGVPEGLVDVGGALLTRPDPYGGAMQTTELSISEFRDGDASMLFLSRMVDRSEAGRLTWEVLDVEEVPELPPGVDVMLLPTCERDGEFDPEVISAVACEPDEAIGDVTFLWRVDLELEQIELIDMAGWVCECPLAD